LQNIQVQKLIILADYTAWPCRQFARLGGYLLLVLTAVIFFDVVARKVFDAGSYKLQELEWHIHGAIAMLGFGYAYINNSHVRIDLFSSKFSSRLRLWVEFWAILLVLIPFMSYLLWTGAEFAARSYAWGEVSSGDLGLTHRWVIKSMIPLSALLTISGSLSVALRCLIALKNPDQIPNPIESSH
jgi:TRAP-type mannitol/chloroaromatic compound transport system permease small subunit